MYLPVRRESEDLPEALHGGHGQVDRVVGGQADQQQVERVAQLPAQQEDQAEGRVAGDAEGRARGLQDALRPEAELVDEGPLCRAQQRAGQVRGVLVVVVVVGVVAADVAGVSDDGRVVGGVVHGVHQSDVVKDEEEEEEEEEDMVAI